MDGHEVHDHEVDGERGQVRAVPDRARPSPVGAGGGVHPAAPASHLVLLVLGNPHGHLRYLVLLVAVDHPQVDRIGQIDAAAAVPGREPVALLVGVVGERKVRTGRAGLLAPRASTLTSGRARWRRRLARVVIA